MRKKATLSKNGIYRYMLYREWDKTKPTLMFIMLNPSTADAYKDDPTIRRCISFAKELGYGSLYVGNLFPFRSPSPKELSEHKHSHISMDINKKWVKSMYGKSEKTIAAWGSNYKGKIPLYIRGMKLYTLRINASGSPAHPLYLPKYCTPELWRN